MKKMYSGQLFALLFLSGAWSVICLPALYGSGQMIGVVIVCILQCLMCLPMLYLSEHGVFLTGLAKKHRILGLLYVFFFLLWGGRGFSALRDTVSNVSVSGKSVTFILLIVTCLYTSSLGLRAASRCAQMVLGIFLVSMLVLTLGGLEETDVTRLTPPTSGILQGGFSYFCLGGEMTAAWVLLEYTARGQKRTVRRYLSAKAGLCLLILFLCRTAAGRLAQAEDYPFFTLTALSQPLQTQRADALYILVYVMLYVMHITLQTGVTAHLLKSLFPKIRFAAPLSLPFMLLLSWLPDTLTSLFGILILLTGFLIPLAISLYRRYSHETKQAASPAAAESAADGLQ